jgi:hypothetical protein
MSSKSTKSMVVRTEKRLFNSKSMATQPLSSSLAQPLKKRCDIACFQGTGVWTRFWILSRTVDLISGRISWTTSPLCLPLLFFLPLVCFSSTRLDPHTQTQTPHTHAPHPHLHKSLNHQTPRRDSERREKRVGEKRFGAKREEIRRRDHFSTPSQKKIHRAVNFRTLDPH